ncbi:MAG: PilT/PilU family type 4a pilus ATPase [Gemmataceae bacterium]|nr:PilT/PilU family type 4a pilus ATPase [Gemmataceae bacterium]
MSWSLDKILRAARQYQASDIHLIHRVAPAFRIGGDIQVVNGPALDEDALKGLTDELLTDRQKAALYDQMQLCFSRYWEGIGRCRVSIYFHGGCPEFALRLCELRIREREELRIPAVVDDLTRLTTGLILVTGATGSGKTTTLNYMIDLINRERRAKIVTIEDPVEYVHENRRSLVVQQEVYIDTPSFRSALTHVLRQDPDVIVVGEMRDLETVATAITAAETGHLVLATLHTPDSVQTIQRVFSVFPSEQQNNIRYQLSNCLQAIVAQNLLPRTDGKGVILATEICVATPAIRKFIRDGNPHMIYSELQTGKKLRMQTMDSVLLQLYQKGEITYDTAVSYAREAELIRTRGAGEKPRLDDD